MIVLFHKKGKPKTETKSYRPVSLLPTLGKILEKLLLGRLNFHLRTNNLQAPNQYGFTANKSSEEAIVDFMDEIETARSTNQHALAISLDIKGAFDHLEYNSIKTSLNNINFPSNTKETLIDLLSGRQVILNTPQGPATLPQHRGCPQGSCTGPAFWNLVANEVLTQSWPDGVHLQAFADDFIFLKCFNSTFQDDEWKKMQKDKNVKVEEKKRSRIENFARDIEEIGVYSIDIKKTPASIQRKHDGILLARHENYQEFFKEQKKMAQIKRIEGYKETNVESISNDIEEMEIYPMDITYIPASIRRKHEMSLPQAYDDQKYLNELKEMLQDNELSRDIRFEDDFLRSYITSNDYKMDHAFSKIQNLLKLRINHNYFFHNLSFDFTQYPAYRFITILPYRQKDGSAILLFELAKWDPEKVPLEHLKQILFITGIQSVRNPVTQASGLNIIYDFIDAGFQYIKYCTPQNLFLLNHVEILYIHSSEKELLDFFPPSVLPTQYGGNLIEYYAADWYKKANLQHGNYPAEGQKNIF
ncbi:unnamed protein product [Larinioides sclopetarius]|uniref:Reverse transcriptase domain-containing protein n=1 Tax=Larinioides sclopetarius TaxID=280406 RepID=A0AAV1ZPP4_9ARAC